MTQQPKHFEFAHAIDEHISDSFRSVAYTPQGDRYRTWYAQLLTVAALLAATEKVAFVHADYDQAESEARVVIFTTRLVIIFRADPEKSVVALCCPEPPVPRGPFMRPDDSHVNTRQHELLLRPVGQALI